MQQVRKQQGFILILSQQAEVELVLLQISLFTLFGEALAHQNPGSARPASAELRRGLSTVSLAVVEDEGGF